MLAELSTTSITKAKDPQNLEENMQCATEGGEVARVAREQLEAKTGRAVVSPLSAKRFFAEQKTKSRRRNNKTSQANDKIKDKNNPKLYASSVRKRIKCPFSDTSVFSTLSHYQQLTFLARFLL